MNPYENIESAGVPVDMHTWESASSPFFGEIIAEIKPKTIIEVGSWKGASAIKMAALTATMGTKIYCCDTWLGDVLHHLHDADKIPWDQWGYPRLYHQFLTNVKAAGYQDRITPIPMCSVDGSRYLKIKGVKASLIYIDAGHDMVSCYEDIKNFWEILEPGGVIFGDDHLVFASVFAAVIRFSCETGFDMKTKAPFWILRKPA